ncbi:MAG: YjbQ family protein [candidate division Zixibacteria bacterium]|nr:YjbQ family protein [candidate division Zixibacteria bacterium]
MIKTEEIKFDSSGDGDIIDLTCQINERINLSGINSGITTIFTPSATSAITSIEYEPGLLQDLPEFFQKLIPSGISYKHDQTWHDGNGYAHLRAALVGPDITVPFVAGRMTLGTWQQIVFLDFDNRARNRKVIVQIIGE